ncbi:anti-sigma-I factor RsgI family protein [Gracilibacillus massiliensis]|uniref:anti-sigma-I factor RsgI family protein n=1 Tax=Gracilibacillus massiliensis TaxID=1564956 RepID=UPI00071E0A50|nr:hypothetical protein [Gracilibacillus massiliensis]
MKKGIIVEHNKRYTIVMDKNGMFHKAIPIKEKEIGMETYYQPKKKSWFLSLFFIGGPKWKIAPMILICLLLLSPMYIWIAEDEEAYAVVNIDINPSIKVMIDEDYQVLEMEAMNKDADQLLKNMDLKGHTITSLTDELIEFSQNELGLNKDRPVLMAVSYYDNQAENKQFEEKIDEYYQQLGYKVAIYEVAEELRTQAETDHISMNQLTAEQINNSDNSEVTNLSSENNNTSSSLDDEEKELIQNYYNKDEEEEKKDDHSVEEDQSDASESSKEPKVLPVQANERSQEKKAVNGEVKENHGQKVKESAKNQEKQKHGQEVSEKAKNKEKKGQGSQAKKTLKKDNHGQRVSKEAKKKKKPNFNKQHKLNDKKTKEDHKGNHNSNKHINNHPGKGNGKTN